MIHLMQRIDDVSAVISHHRDVRSTIGVNTTWYISIASVGSHVCTHYQTRFKVMDGNMTPYLLLLATPALQGGMDRVGK